MLVGFDFPIGIPKAYADIAGIESFAALLPELGRGQWASFYEVADGRRRSLRSDRSSPNGQAGRRTRISYVASECHR